MGLVLRSLGISPGEEVLLETALGASEQVNSGLWMPQHLVSAQYHQNLAYLADCHASSHDAA